MMPYCALFDAIKSTLEAYDRNVQPFSKLLFRSGNEQIIKLVSKGVQKVLIEFELISVMLNQDSVIVTPIPGKEPELRQVMMFLMLNTDIDYGYDIAKPNPEFAHVIGICPSMPKFMFIAVVGACALDASFYEFLSYAPAVVTYIYFDTALESLKYNYDVFAQVYCIEHLFCALIDSTLRASEEPLLISPREHELINVRYVSYVNKLLLYCLNPEHDSTGRLAKLKKRERKRYVGYAIRHLIITSLHLVRSIEGPLNLDEPPPIYQIKKMPLPINQPPILPEIDFTGLLLKMYLQLQNTLQSMLMSVDIDMYLDWSEMDEGTLPDNLQVHISELAYELNEFIGKHDRLKHDVRAQLQQFAVKPVPLAERAQVAPLGALLYMVDDKSLNREQRIICIDELFKRPIVFGNDECLDTIKQNMKLLDAKHCIAILEYIKLDHERAADAQMRIGDNQEESDYEENDYTDLLSIVYKILQQLSIADVLKVLCVRDNLFQQLPRNICTQPQFEQRLNIYWNSFGNTFYLKEFLLLCFEQPWLMWQRFLEICTRNMQLLHLFVRTYSDCQNHSRIYYHAALETIFNQKRFRPAREFIELCAEVYGCSYTRGTVQGVKDRLQFWSIVTNRMLAAIQESNEIDLLIFFVTLAKHVSLAVKQQHMPWHKTDADRLVGSLLHLLVPIIDWARWVPGEFSEKRAELLTLACDCLLKECSVLNKHSVEHMQVSRNIIRDFKSMPLHHCTFYYLAKISQKIVIDFYRYMIPEGTQQSGAQLAIMFMRCTQREMQMLAINPYFWDTLMLAVAQVHHICTVELRNQAAYNNYIYIYQYVSDRLLKCIKNPCYRGNDIRPNPFVLMKHISGLISDFPDNIYYRLVEMSEPLFLAMIAYGEIDKSLIRNVVSRLPSCPEQNRLLEQIKDDESDFEDQMEFEN